MNSVERTATGWRDDCDRAFAAEWQKELRRVKCSPSHPYGRAIFEGDVNRREALKWWRMAWASAVTQGDE